MALISRGLIRAGRVIDSRLSQTCFGVQFENPLGLAAGFDKDCVALDHWEKLGFGFAEVGTITCYPQPGNPQLRLFRLPEDKGIINRMGFNNRGAEAAAARFARSRARIPIGINLGKSKITEIGDAASDYQRSFQLLHPYGDYFVINVSSPNTLGLRSLQDKGPLIEIIRLMQEVSRRPLFVKIAPDLELDAVDDVIDVVESEDLTGVVATNTTMSRDGLSGLAKGESGGLSGLPLRNRSNEVLAHLGKSLSREKTLIGVGGIFTGRDVYEKLVLGAHLVQIYTGWIYRGPSSAPRILRELLAQMEKEGVPSVSSIKKR